MDDKKPGIHQDKTLVKPGKPQDDDQTALSPREATLSDQPTRVKVRQSTVAPAQPASPPSEDETVPSALGSILGSAPGANTPSQTSITDSKLKLNASGEVGIGTVLRDRFVLESELGTGGMGAVYRALDLRKQEAGDNKPYIAIKLLKGAFKHHQKAFVTLQREAKKTQELAHPNIVTVYDFDRVGDLVYLTMEELKGKPLKDVIKGQSKVKLDYKTKIRIITEIARGLAYAHSKGIIHSDLKPANIFLTENGTIKILDFGIARAANEELYQDNFDAGELGALTYPYASLEMILNEHPHPADDIYALGIIACELLGGKHPYERKDAQHALDNKFHAALPKFRNPLMTHWLHQAVALRRADRLQSATAFIKKLHFANAGPRRISGIAAVIVLAVLGNYIYLQNVELEAVPFSSLTKEQQQLFMQHISESNRALTFGDLDGAVYFIDQAFAIHQTHDPLLAAKDKIKLILQQNIDAASDENSKALFTKQLDELLKHPAFANAPIVTNTN